MKALPPDQATLEYLAKRVGRVHLRQRLGIERDNDAMIHSRGAGFFHIENWYSIHSLIRWALRLTGMHARGRRNSLAIRVTRQDVHLPTLPRVFDGFTILQISDLHVDMHGEYLDALIARVHDLHYDLCVLTGDYRYRTYGPWEASVAGMERLRAHLKDPIYGVLGNHDSIHMVQRFESAGVRMLLNEAVRIERGDEVLHLAGIDDAHYYGVDNIEKASQDIPHGACAIMLSHTPETYQHVAHAGFDFMLCGHTHGGQICLPGGIPILTDARCPRRYARGLWRYHDLIGYTSVGAGSSIVDVRLNCLPEVVLHRLICGNESSAD
ncbi:MAG: metallophosphoesterase family protein [Pseudomonadota bacterium]|nr:MAG: metallophosphoesterase family protein [Pseudomonadota bacterium]